MITMAMGIQTLVLQFRCWVSSHNLNFEKWGLNQIFFPKNLQRSTQDGSGFWHPQNHGVAPWSLRDPWSLYSGGKWCWARNCVPHFYRVVFAQASVADCSLFIVRDEVSRYTFLWHLLLWERMHYEVHIYLLLCKLQHSVSIVKRLKLPRIDA